MARVGPSEPKTGERRFDAVDRRRQALELRKAGVDFRSIAERLGYEGPSGAHKAVVTALKEITKQPAEEVRELELARLDAMLLSINTQIRAGNFGAVDRGLRIMERRAKLLGLDLQPENAPPANVTVRIVGFDADDI